ncbi:GtrA family protein [Corynebacterium breve]|uniref:GtrA family protein n=1 Tax=Corynebacterium breve TaxID=3049799 RepID=A0ABY8VED5_9CORY|nr:GtrA family protein [Corynebacterium breve]WIM67873.1 GtrA family protein [Corynebacterium breve]
MADPISTAWAALRAANLHKSDALHAQAARFGATGAISAGVDVTLTWLLQIGLGVLGQGWARSVGYVAGTFVAYLLNRRFTFRAQFSKRRFVAVIALYTLSWLANVELYHRIFVWLHEATVLTETPVLLIAYAISQGLITVVNFVVQRSVIFRPPRGTTTKFTS